MERCCLWKRNAGPSTSLRSGRDDKSGRAGSYEPSLLMRWPRLKSYFPRRQGFDMDGGGSVAPQVFGVADILKRSVPPCSSCWCVNQAFG
jgi:hypothetical protein